MKNKLKYILVFIILVAIYILGGKLLDKIYLSRYDIKDYTGQDRYATVNSVLDKKYKKSELCYFVNTNYLAHGISLSPYAYNKDIPIFYIKKNEIPKEVYTQMKKMGVKKVIIIGGTNYISNAVVRSLDRSDIKSERMIAADGIDFSILIADKMKPFNKSKSIAIVTDDDLDIPNGITFLPYADRNNIPVFVIKNNENNIEKLEKFVSNNGIKKTYVIGINNYYNTNLLKILPGVERIAGRDRFDIDRKIIEDLYSNKNNGRLYISKGGEVVHKRILAPGQMINALAITSLAADNNSPIMYIENNYFSSRDEGIIEKNNYKQLNEVGFKIERRKFFNVERFKSFTTIVIVMISIIMLIRVIRYDKRPYNIIKVKN